MEAQVRELARKYLKGVKEAGSQDLRATCPFCDHRRTFVMSLSSAVWWCFKCQDGGGMRKFLSYLGLTPEQIKKSLDKINAHGSLPTGVEQRRKLLRAFSTPETLPEFLLLGWKACPISLLEQGFEEDVLEYHEVGYDPKHDRITFPIRDHVGRLVAVSGRACEDSNYPRYKVYDARPPDSKRRQPAGELYGVVEPSYVPSNRNYLYGIHDVYPGRYYDPREREQPLILVEGYKACLWLRQNGFLHTLALQGFSLTDTQRRVLQRMQGPYYVLLDWEPGKQYPDDQGRCAAVRIAERLSKSGQVLIGMYPGFVDGDPHRVKPKGTSPDDLTVEEIGNTIRTAKTVGQLEIGESEKVRAREMKNESFDVPQDEAHCAADDEDRG